MASWQARLLGTFLKLTMKRASRRPFDPLVVRHRLSGRPGAAFIPPGWTVSPGDLGGVPCAVAGRPGLRGDVAVLYLHGGGYFFGSPLTHRPLILAMAECAEAPCYGLDYRLAPEHPFPAALEDALSAYRALSADRAVLIAGDSAGGGLALALACAARDAGLRAPVAVIAFSPWTDLANTGAAVAENTTRCAMFTAPALHQAAGLYLAGADPADPRASPLHADLAGLPPLLLFAGRDEMMRDDTTRFAARAGAAGVAVEMHLVAGVPHVWPMFARWLPEGRDALGDVRRFIARIAPRPLA